jgi:hypothetical protein
VRVDWGIEWDEHAQRSRNMAAEGSLSSWKVLVSVYAGKTL